MELKLEELVPYLPYKLQCMAQGEGKKKFELQGISDISYADLHEKGRTVCEQYDIEDVFPILKPLSDLSNEIEEGKPMFFPSHKLIKHIEQQQDIFNCSYSEIDYLIRNHFDVSGLIEKGLAIDINTL